MRHRVDACLIWPDTVLDGASDSVSPTFVEDAAPASQRSIATTIVADHGGAPSAVDAGGLDGSDDDAVHVVHDSGSHENVGRACRDASSHLLRREESRSLSPSSDRQDGEEIVEVDSQYVKFFHDEPAKSIGVHCRNARQRVQDMFEQWIKTDEWYCIKIGITSHPFKRWYCKDMDCYQKEGYHGLNVISKHSSAKVIKTLEWSLIEFLPDLYSDKKFRFENWQPGGEGMHNWGPPYFCYVAWALSKDFKRVWGQARFGAKRQRR